MMFKLINQDGTICIYKNKIFEFIIAKDVERI